MSVLYGAHRVKTAVTRCIVIRSDSWRALGSAPQPEFSTKLYLTVPYMEKNRAKAKGAKWDGEAKLWFVPENLVHRVDSFKKWKPQERTVPIVTAVAEVAEKPVYELPIRRDTADEGKVDVVGGAEEEIVEVLSESEANELVVIYDIETTGLYKQNKFRAIPLYNQLNCFNTCRIVQMSYVVCKRGSFDIVGQGDIIVKSDGFKIENEQFHGVTTERSEQEGIPFEAAIKKMLTACKGASYLIAHNATFDVLVTRSEMFRYNLNDDMAEFDALKVICSMKKTRAIVQCRGKDGRTKSPKLKELYEFATEKEIKNEHNAMFDVLNLHDALRILWTKNRLRNLFD